MKIAVITGASSGLGGEISSIIADKKDIDEIWLVARRRDRLELLASKLSVKSRIITADLTERSCIDDYASLLASEKPDVKYLVNAAGAGKIGDYSEISSEDNDMMIDLNCRAAVDMTVATLPYMNKGSHIMEVCSTAAFQPFQYLSVYAASKAFLYRYSRALRVELFNRRISVTTVCPYWISDTEFIPVARKTGSSTGSKRVRHFVLSAHKRSVARMAVTDMCLGFAVSTPGPVCFVHRIVAKFIPHEIMMGLWALIRRI
jgi:short-subunit dehydrogenase